MEQVVYRFIAGVLCFGAFVQSIAAEEAALLSPKAVDRRMEFQGNEHVVLGEELPNRQPQEDEKSNLLKNLDYGALFEVEMGHNYKDGKTEITMATIELGVGLQIIDWLRGDLVFLYEEDDTEPMEVDQAILTLGNTDEFPLFMQFGKMYVPFGNFDSFFVSDPIVLELGETLERGVLLGFEKGGVRAGLTAFNGDVETDGENHADNLVAAVSYGMEVDDISLDFGAAWIRNIMDSDGLTGVLDDAGYVYTSDDIGGLNAWATAAAGPATLIVEYVKTLDDVEIDGVDIGMQPDSVNLELGFALSDRLDVAAKVEKSSDVADWFAEDRYGVVGSFLLTETEIFSAALALEYLREDFGNGAENADVVTAQLALEF